MRTPAFRSASRPDGVRERGFSLIELMISMTIGLMVLGGLLGLLASQSRSRAELDRANRLIDNGRYATEVLSDDLRHAGFYGTFDPTGIAIPAALPDPCATALVDIEAALPLHTQGIDNVVAGSAPACVGAVMAGTDIVVIRRVETKTINIAAVPAASTTRYLQVSLCATDPVPYKLDTRPANFTLRNKQCDAADHALLRRLIIRIYFIAPDNIVGDGIPTLKRAELTPAGTFAIVPLVEGVQNLQIDYGIDNSGDGVADVTNVCAACTPADWSNVVAVRAHVLARSKDATMGHTDTATYSLGLAGTVGPFNDRFKRRVFVEFTRSTNLAGRRET